MCKFCSFGILFPHQWRLTFPRCIYNKMANLAIYCRPFVYFVSRIISSLLSFHTHLEHVLKILYFVDQKDFDSREKRNSEVILQHNSEWNISYYGNIVTAQLAKLNPIAYENVGYISRPVMKYILSRVETCYRNLVQREKSSTKHKFKEPHYFTAKRLLT